MASFVTFSAFMLLVLAEITHFVSPFLLPPRARRDVLSFGLWILMLAPPLTSAPVWFAVSIQSTRGIHMRLQSSSLGSLPESLAFVFVIARRYKHNTTFAIYQGVAWVLYVLVLILLAASSSNADLLGAPPALGYCVTGGRYSLAVLAFIAEELIISSVLALEERCDRNLLSRRGRFIVQLNNFNNMLLLVGAVVMATVFETTRLQTCATTTLSLNAGICSLMLFLTALLNTYGLGGVLSTKDGWRFFQPFVGGTRFIVLQTIAWTCFAAGLLLQVLTLTSLIAVDVESFMGTTPAVCVLFLIAEVSTILSLLVFRRPSCKQGLTMPNRLLKWLVAEVGGVILTSGLVNLQFIPNMLFFVYYRVFTSLSFQGILVYGAVTNVIDFSLFMAPLVAKHMYIKDSHYGERSEISKHSVKYVLPCFLTGVMPAYASYHHYASNLDEFCAVFAISIAAYAYLVTFRGDPPHTGCRMRTNWVKGKSVVIENIRRYFSGRIITSAPPLHPSEQYIMAFHPHGILPLSVMWLQFTDAWRQLLPNIHARILTASVLHQMPLARDILQFFGGREVTRQAFVHALNAKENVMLVPGGQAEMLEQRSGVKQVRVITHHKGFIRIAIEHGVSLVPVLSFREGELLSNVYAPSLQRWFITKLGFPFPYFPYGRWFLPVPRQEEVAVAVGAPLAVEKVENPSQEVVDKVHAEYFSRLEALFHEHKKAAGCEDFELVLI